MTSVYAPHALGRSAADREAIDDEIERIDGQPGFSRYGGNASLAVSLAITIANAEAERTPLWQTLDRGGQPLIPMPMVNILSGGAHAGRAIDLQDFLAGQSGPGRCRSDRVGGCRSSVLREASRGGRRMVVAGRG